MSVPPPGVGPGPGEDAPQQARTPGAVDTTLSFGAIPPVEAAEPTEARMTAAD